MEFENLFNYDSHNDIFMFNDIFIYNNQHYRFDKDILKQRINNYLNYSQSMSNFFWFFYISEEESIKSENKNIQIIEIYKKKFLENNDFIKFKYKVLFENNSLDLNSIILLYRENLFQKFKISFENLCQKINFLKEYFNHYSLYLNEKEIFDFEISFVNLYNNIYYIKNLSKKNQTLNDIFNFNF